MVLREEDTLKDGIVILKLRKKMSLASEMVLSCC